jgi:hypothetical protein
MDEKSKKEIILQAVEIVENAEFINDGDQTKFRVKDRSLVYNQFMGKILSKLRKERYIPKEAYSKEHFYNVIDVLISQIYEKGTENIRKNPLEADIFDQAFYEVFVCLILDGVTMSLDSIELGGMTLKKLSKEKIDLILSESIVDSSFLDDLIGKVYIEFKTMAEPERALKIAEKESGKILDLIRYSIPFIYDRPVFVGLQGDTANSTRRSFVVNSDYKLKYSGIEFTGGVYNFDISNRTIQIMKNNGVDKIAEILQKPSNKITDFERGIILGVHWFAYSQTQTELENEFLSLMICLEIFLTPNDGSPISTSISDAAAIILGFEDGRKTIKTKISEFYTIRSRIVHGRGSNVKEHNVKMLKRYLMLLIPFMVNYKERFEKIGDLIDLINEYKLSGGIFKP